jgi:hypothetical protein
MDTSIFEPLTHHLIAYLPFFAIAVAFVLGAFFALFKSIGASIDRQPEAANATMALGVLFAIVGIGAGLTTMYFQNQEIAAVQDNFRTAAAKTYGVQLDGSQAADLIRGWSYSQNFADPANGTRYGKTETAIKGEPVDLVLYYAEGQYRLASSSKLQELPRRSA